VPRSSEHDQLGADELFDRDRSVAFGAASADSDSTSERPAVLAALFAERSAAAAVAFVDGVGTPWFGRGDHDRW
jgi:hypothetical protein